MESRYYTTRYMELLEWARAHERDTIALIREMVELESPSDDPAALGCWAAWFCSRKFGKTSCSKDGHLICELDLAGRRKAAGQILVLGHYDTVWPIGTLARMSFRENSGRLLGPGVLDMKGGIALFLMAARAVQELGIPVLRRVLLQLNADEETGSRTSRALTEKNARASRIALVLEPGAGLKGFLKTARKGVGAYELRVLGHAAHAGVDFAAGVSAVLELSRQIAVIEKFTNIQRGVTVNPGVIGGGTRSNVIAAEAFAHIDVRVKRLVDAAILDRKFRGLKPFDRRCALRLEGGLNRPPMERTKAIADLFRRARRLGAALGIKLEESATGGGSDGNFTAALGVPTLDGLGAVGEGAHADNESIFVDQIAPRTALLAALLAGLSED